MDQAEVTKLLTFIEEKLRSSPSSGLQFVDARRFRTRLDSQQNHVVFGRRGAGKTSLVNSIRGSKSHLDIYIDVEDYKDITFPNIVIRILLEMFTALDKQTRSASPWYKFSVKANRIRKQIKVTCAQLGDYLRQPDQETQEISTKDAYDEEFSVGAGSHSMAGGAGTKHATSTEVKRSFAKSKIAFLRTELTTYKKLLTDVPALFSNRPVFLILDDFYFVPKDTQPELIDYFHRLTKGTGLFLKVATIKYRSKLYRRTENQYVGVELGHDVLEVDMDYTLDAFDDLKVFMRQLLDSAINSSTSRVTFDEMFAGDGFPQLCLASGGVPRDFLSLFVYLGNNILAKGQAMGKVDVNDAAIANIRSKMESMKKDSGSDDAILSEHLNRIKEVVFRDKRTNTFLIAKDELEKNGQLNQVIRELVDLRFIHLVGHNTSKAPSDGKRYEAYILDVGLYDNSRPRNFKQIEPGQRDANWRMDDLRGSPVISGRLIGRNAHDSAQTPGTPLLSKHSAQPATAREERQLEMSFE